MSLRKIEDLLTRKPYLRYYLEKNQNLENPYALNRVKDRDEYYVSLNARNLASSVAPLTAARRLIGDTNFKPTDLVIVLGLGNPHIPELVNDALPDNQILLLIDESPAIFEPLKEEFLLRILDIPGRHIFLGENALPMLWNYIESLPIERLSGLKFLRNQPSISQGREFFESVEAKISQVFSSKMSDLLTKFEFERIWVKNSLANILGFYDKEKPRFRIKDYFDRFNGIPAVLVSAGPSLRSQCEILKEIRDKVFILSCDTSLKVLLKFGIVPDAVMTLDAQTHSYYHFFGEDEALKKIPLFADFVTSPSILRGFPFLSIVHSMTAKFQVDASGKPYREVTAGGKIVDESLGEIGDIQSGGSVATSAFDILRQMGFGPIFLFGQDLAYTGREIHSTGTHHNEKWLTLVSRYRSLEKINEQVVRKRQTREIPSCDGKTVLTDYVLEIYKHWFEESAKTVQTEVYNVNTRGSFIENMQNILPEEARTKIQAFSDHRYPWKELNAWNHSQAEESRFSKEELKAEIFRELELMKNAITNNNTSYQELKEAVTHLKFLKQTLRKTEIYLQRHDKELDEKRKRELLTNAIQKEVILLKRGLISL